VNISITLLTCSLPASFICVAVYILWNLVLTPSLISFNQEFVRYQLLAQYSIFHRSVKPDISSVIIGSQAHQSSSSTSTSFSSAVKWNHSSSAIISSQDFSHSLISIVSHLEFLSISILYSNLLDIISDGAENRSVTL
jgi:hypothetical protein